MKQITFIVFGLLFFAACKNDKPANKMDSDENLSTEVKEEVKEMESKKSMTDYEAAIEAFTKGEKAKAAAYLDNNIKALREESKDLEQSAKADVDAVIASLETLSTKVKDGTIKEAGEVKAVFAKAEMAVAHGYMVISQKYVKTAPEKAEDKLRKAVQKMENASKHMEGAAKSETHSLIADMKAFLAKGDKKANEIGNHVGEQVIKVKEWMKKHAAQMGLHLPPQDPDE